MEENSAFCISSYKPFSLQKLGILEICVFKVFHRSVELSLLEQCLGACNLDVPLPSGLWGRAGMERKW